MIKKISKLILCCALFCIVLIQSGCTTALNFRHEYDKGMLAYNEKDYDTAIVNFTNALNYKPDSYSALCLLGTSYAYKKDAKMAEKTFQDAIKLYPDEWNAYVFLGDLKKTQHDYASAIDFYETAVGLSSMGGKEKSYYKTFIKQIKNEQTAFLSKKMMEDKNAVSAAVKFKSDSRPSYDEKGEAVLNIDLKNAEKIYDQKDENGSLSSYLVKDGDVQKIVTTQYLKFNKDFKCDLKGYFENEMKKLDNLSKTSGKKFEKKILTQKDNELLYEWKFDGGKESELAKIVTGSKGLYHIHIAKQAPFTNDEKVKFIDALKTAELK